MTSAFEQWASETLDWGNTTYSRRKLAERAFEAGMKAAKAHYRDWIKQQGEVTGTCTFGVLGEICDGCKCSKGENDT